MAKKKVKPEPYRDAQNNWCWFREDRYEPKSEVKDVHEASNLLAKVFEKLEGGTLRFNGMVRVYKTNREAMAAYTAAIQ